MKLISYLNTCLVIPNHFRHLLSSYKFDNYHILTMINKKNPYSYFLLIFICLVAFAFTCSSKKKTVVAEIGKDKIYLYQFEDQFIKSVGSLDSAKKTSLDQRKEFLDLMIKFRLKTMDARERGLLESQDIQTDLNEYKKNFITAFVIDKYIVEPNIKKLYELKKDEVRASHIMVNLPMPAPSPEDSIKAYEKAAVILERLKNGEDFGVVAAEMSDDVSGKSNGGDLYWFTGGMTVPEFENGVYKLKKGQTTKEPIRTVFGLHIVKLTDRQPRVESVRASHILIQDQRDSLGMISDSLGTLAKAQDILNRIKGGEDFEKLVEFSDDPGTKVKGGDLGFFERRRMVQQFDSAAFSLKPGQMSDLVRTQFGWHIIKVTEVKKVEPYDKALDKLKTDFKRAPNYKETYDKYMQGVRKDNDFKILPQGMTVIMSKVDSNQTIASNNFDSLFANDREVVVAEYDGGVLKLADVMQYLTVNRDFANSTPNTATVEKLITSASDTPLLLVIAEKKKVEKDEDYIDMLTEYENGLLSFKVDQDELWSKIQIQPADIQQYYETNKDKFSYTDSTGVKYKVIDDVRAEISNLIQQDKFKEMEAALIVTLKNKYTVKINDKALEKAFTEN